MPDWRATRWTLPPHRGRIVRPQEGCRAQQPIAADSSRSALQESLATATLGRNADD
jgi:hypothetical protein